MKLLIRLMESTNDYSAFSSPFIHRIAHDLHNQIMETASEIVNASKATGDYILMGFNLLILGSLLRVQNDYKGAEEKYNLAMSAFVQVSIAQGQLLACEFLLSINKGNNVELMRVLKDYICLATQFQSANSHLVKHLNKMLQDIHK